MENRVRLFVLGFSFNQKQSGTYGLVLEEEGGGRRLMVIVGTPEAQSIAFGLKGSRPPRPLSHDLFLSLMDETNVALTEIFIYKYENGIFYCKLEFKSKEKNFSIDSRTSDAIGIALRTDAIIYTTEDIMQKMSLNIIQNGGLSGTGLEDSEEELVSYDDYYPAFSYEELIEMLDDAVNNEDYELASVIKEEIQKRMKNN